MVRAALAVVVSAAMVLIGASPAVAQSGDMVTNLVNAVRGDVEAYSTIAKDYYACQVDGTSTTWAHLGADRAGYVVDGAARCIRMSRRDGVLQPPTAMDGRLELGGEAGADCWAFSCSGEIVFRGGTLAPSSGQAPRLVNPHGTIVLDDGAQLAFGYFVQAADGNASNMGLVTSEASRRMSIAEPDGSAPRQIGGDGVVRILGDNGGAWFDPDDVSGISISGQLKLVHYPNGEPECGFTGLPCLP